MTTSTPSPKQLRVLQGAGHGEVSKPAPGVLVDAGTWRMGGEAVTATVQSLIGRGLARESTQLVDERVPLVVTADGHRALSKAAHRV